MDKKIEKPIIIVGAARSGTTMLRTALGVHNKFHSCLTEMNYLWRYGNSNYPNDALPPDLLSADAKKYIRKHFNKILQTNNSERLVEKTCANSLRIKYVERIFPDCQFVHIVRDGRGVVASALKRWRSNDSSPYLFKKAITIPRRDLFKYAWRYIKNKAVRKIHNKQHRVMWGPIFPDFERTIKNHSLIEVCGIQWTKTVEKCLEDSREIPRDRYLEIKYEEIIQNPVHSFNKIFDYLNCSLDSQLEEWLKRNIQSDKNQKWQEEFSQTDLDKLIPHIKNLMLELGYIKE